jgi:hypothetical protein
MKTIWKILVFLLVLAILCLAWVGSFWLKYKYWPWNDLKRAVGDISGDNIDVLQGNEATKTEEANSELARQIAMNDLSIKIGELSPEKSVLGGKWRITRFWFANDKNVYIEYEDGHIMRRLLAQISGEGKKPEYKIVAFFEPGENDWILKTGNDTALGKKLDLYEYDEAREEWIKKN